MPRNEKVNGFDSDRRLCWRWSAACVLALDDAPDPRQLHRIGHELHHHLVMMRSMRSTLGRMRVPDAQIPAVIRFR